MRRSQQYGKCDVWWQCVNQPCKGWEWARHTHCRKCGSSGPLWAQKYMVQPAAGAAVDDGYVQMPKGKWARKRAKAMMKKTQAGTSSNDRTEERPAVAEHADAVPNPNPEMLLAQVKKLEATQRLLGSEGPPGVLEELEQALQTAREQLREKAPVPKRLHALQQAIERKNEKAEKLSRKGKDLQAQLEALEPQLVEELAQVRRKYRLLQADLSSQMEEVTQQKECLTETLDEYRTQQNRLLGEATPADKSQEDIAAFMRVTERLTRVMPIMSRRLQKIPGQCLLTAMATRTAEVSRQTVARGRSPCEPRAKYQRGAGVYPTPCATQEDVDMTEHETPTDLQVSRNTYRSTRACSREQKTQRDEQEETPVLERSRTRSERGEVGGRREGAEVDTPCGTSWRQFQGYLEACAVPPHVMCVQEHRKRSKDCVDACSWLRSRNMQGHFEGALAAKKVGQGRGGVAIVARQHIGLHPIAFNPEDTQLFQGRLVAAHVQGMVKGGVVIYSFYGIAGVGIAGNLQLLMRLQTLLREQQLPWMVGADWNLSKAELEALDWATTAGGQIVSTNSPTCANGHR
eukprot:1952092-Amphidinium_carterae.2